MADGRFGSGHPTRHVTAGPAVTQLMPRDATVTWDVTHAVRPEDESLFGSEDDAFKNEVAELRQGQRIRIDDEDIFRSRRGANQESAEKRQQDKAGHLVNNWYRLLEVAGESHTSGGYVREETIILDRVKGKHLRFDARPAEKQEAMDASGHIHEAWTKARLNRRLSKDAWSRWEERRETGGGEPRFPKETSPSWDQFEEGVAVSGDLSGEDMYKTVEEDEEHADSDQKIFVARADDRPAGVLVLSKREGLPGAEGKAWFLRWLLGNPELKGAGRTLMELAKKQAGGQPIWVESAPSAVTWYTSQGFVAFDDENQKKYESVYEAGWDNVLMIYNPV